MNLCIDIGNSRVKTAVFEGNQEIINHRSTDFSIEKIQNLLDEYHIDRVIVSTTRELSPEVNTLISTKPGWLVLDHQTPLPFVNLYETSLTLGKDRLAAAAAANALFPGQNNVIIDAGTCLTYNFIDQQGQYHGGNISPGVQMRLKAMNAFTSKLPLAEIKYHNELFGKNTEMALQNGAVRGAIFEITSFIYHTRLQYGQVNVILTGGDAIIFAEHLNFKIFAVPNLVLFGLNEILRYNADHFTILKH
ncbi:MAG: type III pantothenate kinase [Saprospiraceae bacterium]|nr:type III pantothenate kinase [Saprospiraceae bacterium]